MAHPLANTGLALFVLVLSSSVKLAQSFLPTCRDGFVLAGNADSTTQTCYKLLTYPGAGVIWHKARADCYALGPNSTMAAIRTSQEATAVVVDYCAGLGTANTPIWLGYHVPLAMPSGSYAACKVTALLKNNLCYIKTNWFWGELRDN